MKPLQWASQKVTNKPLVLRNSIRIPAKNSVGGTSVLCTNVFREGDGSTM